MRLWVIDLIIDLIWCDKNNMLTVNQEYLGVIKWLYSRGNMITKNFRQCNEQVKCQLFNTFCRSFYCAPLWNNCTIESLRRVKVAYNRVFRNLLLLKGRLSMSNAFVNRQLDPFVVVLRKLVVSFRSRLLKSDNILIRTLVNSLYFIHSRLSNTWKDLIFKL